MAINDPIIMPISVPSKDVTLASKMRRATQDVSGQVPKLGPIPAEPDQLIDLPTGPGPVEPESLPFTRDTAVPIDEIQERTSAFVKAFQTKYQGAYPHPNVVWDVASSPLLKSAQDVASMVPDIPYEMLRKSDLLFDRFKPQMDMNKINALFNTPQPRSGITLASTINDPQMLEAMISGIEEEEQASWMTQKERWVMEGVAKSINWAGNLLSTITSESRRELHENRDKLLLSTGIGYVMYRTSPGFRGVVDNVFDLANTAGEAMWDGAVDVVKKGFKGWDEWIDRVGLATLTANMLYVDIPGDEPALNGMWGAAASSFVNWYAAQAKMLMAPSTMKQYIGIWKDAYKQAEGKTVAGNLLDIDMNEHPLLYFALDMAYHAGVDFVVAKGLGLGAQPVKLFAAGKLTKYGVLDDVMGVVAKSDDASYIGGFLGFHKTEKARKVAAKLEGITDPKKVAKVISQNRDVYTGSIRPGDLFLWKQAKARIWSAEAASKHPLITSMFQLTPPKALNVWDENLPEYADWSARILQLGPDRIKHFRNAVYKETDDIARIRILKELFKEGRDNIGEARWKKIQKTYKKGKDFILDPHSRDKTYLQMLMPDPKTGQLVMQEVSIYSQSEFLVNATKQLNTWTKEMKVPGITQAAKKQLKDDWNNLKTRMDDLMRTATEKKGLSESPVPAFSWQLQHNFQMGLKVKDGGVIPMDFIARHLALGPAAALDTLGINARQAGMRLWKMSVLWPWSTQLRIALMDEGLRMIALGMNPLRIWPSTKRRQFIDWAKENLGVTDDKLHGNTFVDQFMPSGYKWIGPDDADYALYAKKYFTQTKLDPLYENWYRGFKATGDGRATLMAYSKTDEGARFFAGTGREFNDDIVKHIKHLDNYYQGLLESKSSLVTDYLRDDLGSISLRKLEGVPKTPQHLPQVLMPIPFNYNGGFTHRMLNKNMQHPLRLFQGKKTLEEWAYYPLQSLITNIREEMYYQFYHREMKRFSRLQKTGQLSTKIATEALQKEAGSFAMDMIEKSTYMASRTVAEGLVRDISPFLPAYREWWTFWGKQAIEKPYIATGMARAFKTLPQELVKPIYFGSQDQAWRMKFMPRTLTFFTGGSGAPDEKWYNTFFPGIGPVVTVPMKMATITYPEVFYNSTKWFGENVPGFQYSGPGVPVSSKIERLIYAATGVLRGLTSSGKDWRGVDLPAPFGRTPGNRDRAINLIQAFQLEKEVRAEPEKAIKEAFGAELGTLLWNMVVPISMWASHEDSQKYLDARANYFDISDKFRAAKGKKKEKLRMQVEQIFEEFPLLRKVEVYESLPAKQRKEYLQANPTILPLITGYTEKEVATLQATDLTDYEYQKLVGSLEILDPWRWASLVNQRYRTNFGIDVIDEETERYIYDYTSKKDVSMDAIRAVRKIHHLKAAYQRTQDDSVRDFDRLEMKIKKNQLLAEILGEDIIGYRKDEASEGWRAFYDLWNEKNKKLGTINISEGSPHAERVIFIYQSGIQALSREYPDWATEYRLTPEAMWTN
jgi:hypothetical protein